MLVGWEDGIMELWCGMWGCVNAGIRDAQTGKMKEEAYRKEGRHNRGCDMKAIDRERDREIWVGRERARGQERKSERAGELSKERHLAAGSCR